MPGENLTRIEAQDRARLIKVHSYQVELDLTKSDEVFASKTTVNFASREVGAETFIDAITSKVHSITLNGKNLDVAAHSDGVRIKLPNLAAENELIVDADAFFMNTGEGLHRFVDPVDNEVYLYTQFEVPDSRRMFAVFEQPDLKARFTFIVTAKESWKVISNQPTPEPKSIGSGKATWYFAPTPVLSSYVTALIAGPYAEVRSELTSSDGRKIPLGVFSRKSLSTFVDADYIFEKTRQGFEFFEKQFDVPYPFEKYDQLFVPEFNAGAMENAGAVTFTEVYVFRSQVADATRERRVVTILHELAHMWFGDLVTMKWWNDLWLNESFAEYASHLAVANATEWKETWTTFAASEKSWAYRQDQLPSTHPIVAEINDLADVQVNFDGITYAKGGSVLKQLVAWVGQDKFMAGVSAYFKKHAYMNTELSDLLRELEAQSGRDLTVWSKNWLETSGVNTMRTDFELDGDSYKSFAILQSATKEHPTIRPHRMAVGLFNLEDGKLKRVSSFELDVDGDRTEVPQLVGEKQPDLLLLNDHDLAYTKIRLDQKSWKVALDHLADIEDGLARTLVWNAAWDATRDAEANPRDYVDLVLKNIATETESTTILIILRQLVTTANIYVAEQHRAAVKSQIAEALLNLARKAKPGSDAQLQFLRFAPQFAFEDAQLDALEALLSGQEKISGLEIDADLRWDLITGLAVAGRVSATEIDAELEKDNTANGQKAAAGARAALPGKANKDAAWNLLVESKQLSNALVQSASLGFTRVADAKSLEDYVDRYFESAIHIWNSNTFKIAEYLLINLYPMALANPSLAEKTREWIAKPQIKEIAALRRILVENLAAVDRAIKVQELDKKAS